MNHFSNMTERDPEKIVDRVIVVNDRPIGLLRPSTVWGQELDGPLYIYGPHHIVRAQSHSREDFWKALIDSGAILFGTVDEIAEAKKYLAIDRTSRTASYLMATGRNCREFLDRMLNIANSRILIVGCGGIGSLVAMNLAGAGVKELRLVDGDVIEPSNLNRQFMWRMADVGKKKIDVLSSLIEDRFPEVVCSTSSDFVGEKELERLAKSFSLVIISADNPLGLGRSLKTSGQTRIIECGYMHHYSTVSRGAASRNSDSAIQWERVPGFIGPSFGPSNTEIAGIVSSLAIQSIGGDLGDNFELSSLWDSTEFPRQHFSRFRSALEEQSRPLIGWTPDLIKKTSYPALVGYLRQENSPPGGEKTIRYWINKGNIKEKSSILDLACSTGYSSRNTAKLTGCSGVGIDVEMCAIESAKNMAARDGVSHLQFESGDAENLSFKDSEFTHILAGCTFAFIQNQQAAINEVRRVLRGGGILCVSSFFYSQEPPVDVLDAIELHVGFRPRPFWSELWWNNFFETAGFSLTNQEVEGLPVYSDDVIAMEVRRIVFESQHDLTGAAPEVLWAAYEKILAMRLAANKQRKYQGLAIQVWRNEKFPHQ
ncbi:ThiF family adenylyltransferase [Variovorax sp. R-27]|uniref:ThiF family adenylyltransferase n=1 Tax=Variovorax sp. R-27 TaxID=3404058 RepID=UPI003CEF59CC